MSLSYSYRHLYYFWVVAKEGGLTRAAAKLGLSVQTVSTQVRELEQVLGAALLKPAGRGLALTDAGQAALEIAEQIFQIGETLPERVRDAATTPAVRLVVGISDGLPKLVVQRLLQPIIDTPHLRLLCHEDEFDDLLGDLALHRLDVVLADRPAPPNPNLRVYSHALGSSPMAWFASPHWADAAARDFPASLADVPLLLPTAHAAVRPRLDQWLERHGVRGRIAGEFEDSALLATFGAAGMGAFPAAALMSDKLVERDGLVRVGDCDGVDEAFFAIGTDKKIAHPLVRRLLPATGRNDG
ncbi:LysR family transcriptional regulator [Roseateles sp.]|uniref:LysR family transcriptional regulator n=1 Tax=Roseateles sp. TaxID=1971397 RepID=UPI0025E34311|nr:LysR family transcriptional regulator [Roseateles sp.]MBV8034167.1 LysR family transcriptional regulator [Roseateles sp.]